jgi:threonine synthase
MKFYNSRNKNHVVDFRQALTEGLAPGGGLYCPVDIHQMDSKAIYELLQADRHELATEIIHRFTADVMSREKLFEIIQSSINFEIPLRTLSDDYHVLELFHGPTEAFKDVGARFMSRCMSHFLGDDRLTILVATSGDTGSAVADGFWNVEGIDVIVLFPKDGVSPYQQSQMCTLGNNITAIEVTGTFDDCQDLVKQAFQDKQLAAAKNLSSANSINIGRLLPQMLYYFFMAQQMDGNRLDEVSVCVPSGNFGNITSGLYAHKMGLHFGQFIAATNSNTTFPEYVTSGSFVPRPSVATLSNAMDVGKPSNFERILELFNHDHALIKNAIKSIGISDETTIEAMRDVYDKYAYLMDPHAAVGYAATKQIESDQDFHHVILGTAHPRKFEAAVHRALPDVTLEFPKNERENVKLSMDNHYERFKEIVIG